MKEFAHHNIRYIVPVLTDGAKNGVIWPYLTKPTKGRPKCLNVDLMLWFGVQIAFFLVQNVIVLIKNSISEIICILKI